MTMEQHVTSCKSKQWVVVSAGLDLEDVFSQKTEAGFDSRKEADQFISDMRIAYPGLLWSLVDNRGRRSA